MKNELFAEITNISENIRRDQFLQKQLQVIKSAGDEMKNTPIESLLLSDFEIFYKTGSRQEYEDRYFEHRKRLNTYALLAAVCGGEYISLLQDAVWAVLDEFTWALPAHINRNESIFEKITHIDLFAAETGFALSEILYMTEEILAPEVSERIKYEVRRRIIEPYLSGRKNTWDTIENNWAAVCAGSVGAVFLYLAEEEEIKAAMPRLMKTISCYLCGFGDDGACVEGINYWTYGFGYFVYFAELLRRYCGDDLFADEKVKRIALFQQKMRLKGNKTVPFSDCSDNFHHRSGLSHFLKGKYDEIIVPDDGCAQGAYGDNCHRYAHFIRDFAWRDVSLQTEANDEYGCEYFKDASWYINKTEKYDFAAKAGTNNESHNHNDIGCFIINAGGQNIITDPGRGEYTADYFGEGRYKYFAPSALAHSVPIINGRLQKEGEEHRGSIKQADDKRLVIDFAEAYEAGELLLLERTFDFLADKITLTDRMRFQDIPESITEHFVTEERPEKTDGMVRIGGSRLIYDAEAFGCRVSEKTFETGHGKKTVYMIDLELLEVKKDIELNFAFII